MDSRALPGSLAAVREARAAPFEQPWRCLAPCRDWCVSAGMLTHGRFISPIVCLILTSILEIIFLKCKSDFVAFMLKIFLGPLIIAYG